MRSRLLRAPERAVLLARPHHGCHFSSRSLLAPRTDFDFDEDAEGADMDDLVSWNALMLKTRMLERRPYVESRLCAG